MDYYCNYSLLTSGFDKGVHNISVWDGHTGVNLMTLPSQKLARNSISAINDTAIGCVENKAQLEIWKLRNEERKKVISIPASPRAIVYHELSYILACFIGYDVYMWQAETGVLISIISKIHSNPGTQILFISNKVITIDESGLIVCCKININENCDVLWKSRQFGATKLYVALIENRNELFVVTKCGKYIILDLKDGRPRNAMEELSLNVSCIECVRDQVYIGCNQGMLVVYSTADGTVKKTRVSDCSRGDLSVTMMALSPDHESLVMIIDDRMAMTISTSGSNIKQHRQFSFGHPVTNLCTVAKSSGMFSPDSDRSILIKQLNFSFSDNINIHSNTNKTFERQLATQPDMDTEENIAQMMQGKQRRRNTNARTRKSRVSKRVLNRRQRKAVRNIITVMRNK